MQTHPKTDFMIRKFLFSALLLGLSSFLSAQEKDDYQIVVTTPGYTSIYNYKASEFPTQAKDQFRINGNVALNEDSLENGFRRVYVTIGLRQFNFLVTPQMPVIRLRYDRNRRLFTGIGCNFLDREGAKYTPPSFQGLDLTQLPGKWIDDINRQIGDRTLLPENEPMVFLIEVDIDEQGMLQKVVELNGCLRQYTEVIINYIYDRAVRGWEPARRNGVAIRSLAQLRFELKR